MGVTSILVGKGVNLGALRQGLTKFAENVNTSEKNKQNLAQIFEKSYFLQEERGRLISQMYFMWESRLTLSLL